MALEALEALEDMYIHGPAIVTSVDGKHLLTIKTLGSSWECQ